MLYWLYLVMQFFTVMFDAKGHCTEKVSRQIVRQNMNYVFFEKRTLRRFTVLLVFISVVAADE